MAKVVIIMGSRADLAWSEKIAATLRDFGVPVVMRVASAHKVPLACHRIIGDYEPEGVVFITVAGRSNALSGFSDAQTTCPVIACPPPSEAFGGADIFSSLRMPSGVAPLVICEPVNAALAAAKILALADSALREKVAAYQAGMRAVLEKDDSEVMASSG